MIDIGTKLKVKYGLPSPPDSLMIADWVAKTEALISRGRDPEDAGRYAARQAFPGFDTMIYRAQADTIMALLAAAKQRPRR